MKTILVADDHPQVRNVLVDLLSDLGDTVLSAADGREALRMAATRSVDVLLTDIMLPEIDGIELARRATLMMPNLHTIYLTGDPSLVAGRPLYGRVLTKPIRAAELIAEINHALDRIGYAAP
jgi:two-component system cell cycle response regulator CpdR